MEPTKPTRRFSKGDKVKYIPDGTIYDFYGYTRDRNKVLVYEEGECNLQDAVIIDASLLERVVSQSDYLG